VLADKAYDADWLRRQIETAGDVLDIPPMALTDAGNLASTRCFYCVLRVKSARGRLRDPVPSDNYPPLHRRSRRFRTLPSDVKPRSVAPIGPRTICGQHRIIKALASCRPMHRQRKNGEAFAQIAGETEQAWSRGLRLPPPDGDILDHLFHVTG
jgi:hypothetical protein